MHEVIDECVRLRLFLRHFGAEQYLREYWYDMGSSRQQVRVYMVYVIVQGFCC
jgi:hypothetical protein